MNATAIAVYAHRHTVASRLERVRTLTGHDPQTPLGQAQLALGLQALDVQRAAARVARNSGCCWSDRRGALHCVDRLNGIKVRDRAIAPACRRPPSRPRLLRTETLPRADPSCLKPGCGRTLLSRTARADAAAWTSPRRGGRRDRGRTSAARPRRSCPRAARSRPGEAGERRVVVAGDDRDVALAGRDRLVDGHEMDLRALALDPGEAVAQQRRRLHLVKPSSGPERDAGPHLRLSGLRA